MREAFELVGRDVSSPAAVGVKARTAEPGAKKAQRKASAVMPKTVPAESPAAQTTLEAPWKQLWAGLAEGLADAVASAMDGDNMVQGAIAGAEERSAEAGRLATALLRAKASRAGRAELVELERAVDRAAATRVDGDTMREALELVGGLAAAKAATAKAAADKAVTAKAAAVVAKAAAEKAAAESKAEAKKAKAKAATDRAAADRAAADKAAADRAAADRVAADKAAAGRATVRPVAAQGASTVATEAPRSASPATEEGQLSMALVRAKASRAGRAELVELERAVGRATAAGVDGDTLREALGLVEQGLAAEKATPMTLGLQGLANAISAVKPPSIG
eukprot:688808-Prymnesium_polylepis.1